MGRVIFLPQIPSADVIDADAVGRMIVGDGHAFEGGDGLREEDFRFRTINGDHRRTGGRSGEAKLLGDIILGAGASYRNIQAEEIALRTAGNVFGESGAVIEHDGKTSFRMEIGNEEARCATDRSGPERGGKTPPWWRMAGRSEGSFAGPDRRRRGGF